MKITASIPPPTPPKRLEDLMPGDIFRGQGTSLVDVLAGRASGPLFIRGNFRDLKKVPVTRISDGEQMSFHSDKPVFKHDATLNLES